MMRTRAILAAFLLLTAGTAPAARLCRDTKGLFTPCTGERPLPEHHRRTREAAPADDPKSASATGGAKPVSPGAASRPERAERVSSRPPLVATSRLCRDSKGLFTPCAR